MMRFRSSITVFISLLLLVLFSIVLSFVEKIRVSNVKSEVELNAYNSQRNIAASYNPQLWNVYDIFALDISKDIEKKFSEYMQDMINYPKNSLFSVNISDISIFPTKFTEKGGYDFLRQASLVMQARLSSKMMDKLKGGDSNSSQDRDIDVGDVENREKDSIADEYKKDPRDAVKDIEHEDDFLDFVNSDNEKSKKSIDSKKIKLRGKLPKINLMKSILFNEYILSHYTSALNCKNSKNVLDYEVEYILKGELNDKDNLKKVCKDIKLMRIPINYAYIVKNKYYNLAADTAAFFANIWNMNFSAMKATKHAIISAWAYAESALDVKNLLTGGKVPLIKTDETWNLGWNAIFSFKTIKPKKSKKGMTYDDYLRIFLGLKSNKKKILNSMNLIEKNMNLKFDNYAYSFDTKFSYEIDKKFFSPQFINNKLYKNNFVAGYSYK